MLITFTSFVSSELGRWGSWRKFLDFHRRGVYQNQTNPNKGEEGSKFWSFCENGTIEFPL